jgi:hypothetical protein
MRLHLRHSFEGIVLGFAPGRKRLWRSTIRLKAITDRPEVSALSLRVCLDPERERRSLIGHDWQYGAWQSAKKSAAAGTVTSLRPRPSFSLTPGFLGVAALTARLRQIAMLLEPSGHHYFDQHGDGALASRAFAQAFHAWLAAKAGIEDPLIEEDEQPERFRAQSDAERRLFTTPSAYPDQVSQKLEAFEAILGDEIMSGPRRDSVVMLALARIKQDIVNLDLLEAIR